MKKSEVTVTHSTHTRNGRISKWKLYCKKKKKLFNKRLFCFFFPINVIQFFLEKIEMIVSVFGSYIFYIIARVS